MNLSAAFQAGEEFAELEHHLAIISKPKANDTRGKASLKELLQGLSPQELATPVRDIAIALLQDDIRVHVW